MNRIDLHGIATNWWSDLVQMESFGGLKTMQIGYFRRLENDVQHWVNKGLIGSGTGDQLLAESKTRKGGYSFTTVVIMLGVICLGFAAMTFVAANWNEMAKITRVGILLGSMWLAYGISVFADRRDFPFVSDAFVLLGCAIFGATIMLVGQMYHLQGTTEDAVLLWAAGSVFAAVILRSPSALWLAIALFTLWLVIDVWDKINSQYDVNYLFLAAWALCAGLAYWLRAKFSAHLLMVSLLIWCAIALGIWTERYDTPAFAFAAYAALFMLIGLAIISLDGKLKSNMQPVLNGFEAPMIAYFAICIIALTSFWIAVVPDIFSNTSTIQMLANTKLWPMLIMLAISLVILVFGNKTQSSSIYDLAFCAIWIGVATLAVSSIGKSIPYLSEAFALAISIWFIRMGDRQDIPGVRRLGYLAFALMMLFIYFRTAGSLLGTSGFYLTAGLLMVLGAIFLPRLFGSKKSNEEVAQ